MTATIAYDLPVKNLIDELSATGHVTHKAYKKTSVTLHHNGARLSHGGVLSVWQVRPASAHFDIDGKGAACQYVKPNEYAWAVGNTAGNMSTISIEMANAEVGGKWPVSEVTWKAAARLAAWLFAKVIGERPSKDNFFYHHHWSATACAGPFMDSIYDQVLAEAQRCFDAFLKASPYSPSPSVYKPTPGTRPDRLLVAEIQRCLELTRDGYWGDGTEEWAMRMRAAARAHHGYPRNTPADFREDLVQKIIDVTPDNDWGPKSQAALVEWIKTMQKAMGLAPDGWWGDDCEARFFEIRRNNRNQF